MQPGCRNNPAIFSLVPDCFKIQELWIKALEMDPWQLNDIPDYLTTKKKSLWWGSKKRSFFPVVSPWLVCYSTTNGCMVWWRLLVSQLWDYWVVQWLSKNEGPKSKNKRRALAHCLASWSCDGLVYVRRREGVVEVTDSCFKIIWYKNHCLRVYFDLTRPKGQIKWVTCFTTY